MGTKRRKVLHCLYSFTRWFCLGGGDAVHTYMRRDAGEEGGREFSSKMPRTMSNLPDFPRRPFLYAHLLYTKSMHIPVCSVECTAQLYAHAD